MTPSSFAAVITVALLVFASGVSCIGEELAKALDGIKGLEAETNAAIKTFGDCATAAGNDLTPFCKCYGSFKPALAKTMVVVKALGGDDAKPVLALADGLNGIFDVCDQKDDAIALINTQLTCQESTKASPLATCNCFNATMYKSAETWKYYQASPMSKMDPDTVKSLQACQSFWTTWKCSTDYAATESKDGITAGDKTYCACLSASKKNGGWSILGTYLGTKAGVYDAARQKSWEDAQNALCSVVGGGITVSPSLLLIAAFAAVLAGRGLFQ